MIKRSLNFIAGFLFYLSSTAFAAPDQPIVFVGQVPQPEDFATITSTFANHRAGLRESPRGGGLFVRYPDGFVRDLTAEAGFGQAGFQGASSIAVRDPAIHWDANKILFSMVIGAPETQYQVQNYRWQIYEIRNISRSQTPVIQRIEGQPENYNNIMPIYTSDDNIIFVSDNPRNNQSHLYPQLDEYESTPTNTGLWFLDITTRQYQILDHAPSGAFHPIVDSYGRVIFTRWDHLQRDQQAAAGIYGDFDYTDESINANRRPSQEVFPEPWAQSQISVPGMNLHRINQFFPWEMNQDGTELETLNHIGRQELKDYANRSFNNDPNLVEIIAGVTPRLNQNPVSNLFHFSESPNVAGDFYATNAPEFETHSAGQLVLMNGQQGLPADQMEVRHVTHPETALPSNNPSSSHSGLYRDALELQNGELVSSHTTETRIDQNLGNVQNPISRYNFRLKTLVKNGQYYSAGSALTPGITRNVSYYDPDRLVTHNGALWELQARELRPRQRPVLTSEALPAPERAVFREEGVSESQLRKYLRDQGLALIVSRDVTTRDVADRQQPFNLKVAGSTHQTGTGNGKLYTVESLQIIQGDLLRGYNNISRGRRVIGRTLHSVNRSGQPNAHALQDGAVTIAADGSVAAFVPANRALSWQLLGTDGLPLVRERYWLSLQKGEIRVCASCHGINTIDQTGKSEPQNSPEALRQLLRWFSDTGGVSAEGPDNQNPGPQAGQPYYDLLLSSLTGSSIKPATKKQTLLLNLAGVNAESNNRNIQLRLKVGNRNCKKPLGSVSIDGNGFGWRQVTFPRFPGNRRVTLKSYHAGTPAGSLSIQMKGHKMKKMSRQAIKKSSLRRLCKYTRLEPASQ